jgi:ABC-type Fe3+-hydroxamate transport system substrate-binding protein
VKPVRVFDDRRRSLEFTAPPRRVVSLVPSDTLSVAALGCAGALVGRTDYCELPEEVVAKLPSVGGTKNPRVDDVCALAPDLVLANQEENTRGDLEALAQRGVRVYVAFPRRVADGLAHLARLARIFGVERDGAVKELLARGYHALREADEARTKTAPLRAFCPIWMKPLMTIHGDTFISDMLDLCGAQNVFADRERRYPLAADLGKAAPLPPEKVEGRDVRYPRVTLEEVVARAPELVLLPDEPHPFSEEDAGVFRALDIPAAKTGAVVRTGGKDLCWYGSRSVEGISRVRGLVSLWRSREGETGRSEDQKQ